MILYHGTTLEQAEQIWKTGSIKCRIKRSFEANPYFEGTTDGFVYLTNKLCLAYYYGNSKIISCECKNKNVCIFKVDISDELLLADLDELKVKTRKMYSEETTIEDSLRICGCVRCAQDISILGAKYVIIPGTTNVEVSEEENRICRNFSSLALNHANEKAKVEILKNITDKYKWKEL